MIALALSLALQASTPDAATVEAEAIATFRHRSLMWEGCTASYADKYARSTKESADAIVEAAIGECGPDYAATEDGLRKADGGRFMIPSDIAKLMTRLMQGWRPKIYAAVMRARSR